ncbi:MAG: MarR family winged helix-turn-helix transcriptional regulator [Elsteraceae bacterium]
MSEKPREAAVTAWTRLLRAQQTALTKIELALKGAGFPPLSWYDALLELDRGPPAGMRPLELERRMLMPQYGLSRLIDRIEGAGYVARRPCEIDGRGQMVTITEEGRAIRRRMWPVYAAAIQTAVGDRLNEREAETLANLLGKLSAN